MVQASDGLGLAGATVSIKNTSLGVVTNEKGAYVIQGVPRGPAQIRAFLAGFEEKIRTVYVPDKGVTVVDFVLEVEKISVETTVTAVRPLLSASEDVSKITITPSQIETLPSLGARDIFRAFQLLPGISGSNEASSGLYVRGGKPDQNLILFDGFTLYHVEHLYGYFSPFNPDAVMDVRLSKGGFEAKYGGRLSSVMELTGKTGDRNRFRGGAGVSFLNFDGVLEVPFAGKGSLLLAARRSFQSPLYDKIMDLFDAQSGAGQGGGPGFSGIGGGGFAQFETQPKSFFYDLNGKLSYELNGKNAFSLSFYHGMDKLDNSREMEAPPFFTDQNIDFKMSISDLAKWGNWGTSAQWSRTWNESFHSRLVMSYSNYFDKRNRSMDTNVTPSEDTTSPFPMAQDINSGSVEENDLRDLGFKWENDLRVTASNRLEFGLEAVSNRISFSLQMNDASLMGFQRSEGEDMNLVGVLDRKDQGVQYSAYLQDRWTLFGRLTVTPGIRVTRFDLSKETYWEPRFYFNLNISARFKLKGAWGIYHQYANRIIREDIMQGDRAFWMLSDGIQIPVGKAIHYIAGVSYETDRWLFDVEAYHKSLTGLTEFSTRFAPREENVDYNRFFYRGTGTARGMEFLLQKKAGVYAGWISYTLSRTEYVFPDYGSKAFAASHDVPNEFKSVNSFELKKWTFSGTWIYATGRPYTPAVGLEAEAGFNGRTFYRVLTGDKNSARLPDYHRLDLSVAYKFFIESTEAHAGLTVFNVYNRKNVWYKEFKSIEGELIENNIALMGLTFNLFLNFRF